MKIYTADKETGTFIDKCKDIQEAKKLIQQYEEEDRKENIYTADFYDIVNEFHETIKQ